MDRAMYSVAEMPAACSRSSSFDGMQFHESVRTDSLREAAGTQRRQSLENTSGRP